MKKESVNTFNEGLNYDLNPITTPNNVLTDTINGTFITFNADELALQNDAGNTKIMIPGTESNPEYVKLSDGFFPLGMKEYGGILYIVSGKYPTEIPIQFVAGASHTVNNFYFNISGTITLYYKCLVTNTDATLPLESTTNWEFIGVAKDFINKYGEIEFGSYPSPEIYTQGTVGAALELNIDSTETTFVDDIYKVNIINNIEFKAGEYVTFTATDLDSTNISYKEFDANVMVDYHKHIYKVRLLQQLTNGFIDLTDDVWIKYAKFKGGSIDGDFWFNDTNFKYYCPSNFKGKLAISVDLEDLDEFYIDSTNITYDETGYHLEINTWVYDSTVNWNINYVYLEYTTDGWLTSNIKRVLLDPVIGEGRLNFDDSYKGKTLQFKITPEFQYSIFSGVLNSQLPTAFMLKHTLEGAMYITNELDNVIVIKETDTLDTGTEIIYTYLTLRNATNTSNLNTLLEESDTDKYQFYYDHASVAVPAYPLAKFTIVDNKPVINHATYNPALTWINQAYIESLAEALIVEYPYDHFSTYTLNTNISLQLDDTVVVVQGSDIETRTVTTYPTTSFTFEVRNGENFTVYVYANEAVQPGSGVTRFISTDTTETWAVVAQPRVWRGFEIFGTTPPLPWGADGLYVGLLQQSAGTIACKYRCLDGAYSLGEQNTTLQIRGGSYTDYISQVPFTTYQQFNESQGFYETDPLLHYDITFSGTTLTGSYINIPVNDSYVMINSLIFKKLYSSIQSEWHYL